MNSKELGADFVFAWPTAQLGVMGAPQAVEIINRREIAAADDPARRARRARRALRRRAPAPAARRRADGLRRRGDRAERDARARAPPRSRRSSRRRCGAGRPGTSRCDLLDGKRLLITGVLTRGSIAFEVARQAQEAGAEIVLTGFGRGMRLTERAAAHLPDAARRARARRQRARATSTRVAAELRTRWGGLDGVLHAIAFAPADALGGGFLDTPAESAITAFQTSAFSLKALAAALAPLLEAATGGGAVVGLDFDAAVAWPVYDWMGVAKAALESVSRYLARDLGPRGDPRQPRLGRPDRDDRGRRHPRLRRARRRSGAPARRSAGTRATPAPVAAAVCFLLSDLARGITGEILHVDGGFHAMGAPLR